MKVIDLEHTCRIDRKIGHLEINSLDADGDVKIIISNELLIELIANACMIPGVGIKALELVKSAIK